MIFLSRTTVIEGNWTIIVPGKRFVTINNIIIISSISVSAWQKRSSVATPGPHTFNLAKPDFFTECTLLDPRSVFWEHFKYSEQCIRLIMKMPALELSSENAVGDRCGVRDSISGAAVFLAFVLLLSNRFYTLLARTHSCYYTNIITQHWNARFLKFNIVCRFKATWMPFGHKLIICFCTYIVTAWVT